MKRLESMPKMFNVRMIFAYLSCLIVIMTTLFTSEVVFAVNNPKDAIRNTTLKGDPNCTNNGTIYTWTNYGYGMHAKDEGNYASNFGSVITQGFSALGMYVSNRAIATNSGIVSTGIKGDSNYGKLAYGMYASYAANINNEGKIITYGAIAHGMYANGAFATNSGHIITEGTNSLGIYANNPTESAISSMATNNGSVTTHGDFAHGMVSGFNTTVMNESTGIITTNGHEARGMYGNGAKVINSGIITVTCTDADAVYVSESYFVNSGTLDSLHGNAVTAINSTVTFHDGTRLVNSHGVVGDSNSTLTVNMNEDLVVIVRGFGTLNKNGTGIMTLEGGSSAVTTNNNAGTLKIAPDTTFETTTYIQTKDASLHFYVPTNPNVGPPLLIAGDATFAGSVVIDFSSAPLPGKYAYIHIGGEKIGDFDSVSFVNPGGIYVEEEPVWKKGNSWHYTNDVYGADQDDDKDNDNTDTNNNTDTEFDVDNESESADNRDVINKDTDDIADTAKGVGHIYVGYAFSEQALSLVSAIEDWSLLRWIMANHIQDVTSNIHDLKTGQKEYYAHFFANNTDKDPSGKSPLGYESDTKGLSFGFDKKVDDKTIWGIYAGYTEKDIDFTDVVPASSDWEEQDSWHIGAYMSKRFDKWIISDTLTYRTTDHDSFRRQADGDARASFDSWAVTNDIRAGYVVKEIGENSHWEIVPEIGLNVGYFNRDGYTETNGYTYGDYDTTVTEGVIGIRFKGEFISKDGTRFSPYLRLSYVNVLSGDDVTIDETRYGTKRWFTEELDDDYFVADLGMTLYSAGNFDMSLNYNGRFGDDTDSHGGWLRLEWKK